jgi:hypothetical protein
MAVTMQLIRSGPAGEVVLREWDTWDNGVINDYCQDTPGPGTSVYFLQFFLPDGGDGTIVGEKRLLAILAKR